MAQKAKKAASADSSVIDKNRLENFEKREEKTPGGRAVFDTGDKVAEMLRGKDQAELKAVAVKHGFGDAFNTWVKNGLNFGMIRMNTGNKLRAVLSPKVDKAPAKAKKKAGRAKKAA